MGDLTRVGGANLRSWQRDNGNRLAIQGCKFDLVTFSLLVNRMGAKVS